MSSSSEIFWAAEGCRWLVFKRRKGLCKWDESQKLSEKRKYNQSRDSSPKVKQGWGLQKKRSETGTGNKGAQQWNKLVELSCARHRGGRWRHSSLCSRHSWGVSFKRKKGMRRQLKFQIAWEEQAEDGVWFPSIIPLINNTSPSAMSGLIRRKSNLSTRHN